jgi:plasmid stability protein
MPAVTVRNLSAETHRALKVRAAKNGRSTEAEIRDILESAIRPKGSIKLGSFLAEIGREVRLTDDEQAAFDAAIERDETPIEPIRFD